MTTCGTGIARVDLPALYIKGTMHNIASHEKLFETFLATAPIDLTNVGIAIVPPKGKRLKPIPTSELLKHFGLGKKKTGKVVWEHYDSKEYQKIENRTLEEVELNIEIFNRIKKMRISKSAP